MNSLSRTPKWHGSFAAAFRSALRRRNFAGTKASARVAPGRGFDRPIAERPRDGGPARPVPDRPASRVGRIERSRGQPLSDSTATQRHIALLACLAMLVGTALLIPFARHTVGAIPAFFPISQTVAIGSCLLAAYLLYAHSQAVGVTSLLHLAAAYGYTAAVLAMQLASVQGLFGERAPAFGGPQTTVWLWLFWHLAPVLGMVQLALARNGREVDAAGRSAARSRTAVALACATAATATLVFGFHDALPVLDVAGNYRAMASTGLAAALQVLTAVALALLWIASRFRNALHVWLAIIVVALFCDNALTILGGDRSSLGWYGGRVFALLGLSVLAAVYLFEIRAQYARGVLRAAQLASSGGTPGSQAQDSRLQVEELIRADARKDEFLVMLAHELRNPLAPMQSAADLLRVASTDPELVRKTSEMLARQVRQMSGLVEDLLDASRLSRGQARLKLQAVDAKEVLLQSVEQVRHRFDEKAHAMTVLMPEGEVSVAGDPRRLVQVFTNLLVNAARYTPRGGRIEVQLETTDREVVVRVRDNGIGMSPELLGRAFVLFAQGTRAPHQRDGGLGVGLALVKSLVELHHGTVQASSAGEGLGTEVVVRLARTHPAG